MTLTASGHFEVKVTPVETFADGIGRLSLAKTFHGDIDGTGAGEMMAFRTAVDGSAGYVAMEHVTARVHGRAGGFVLQHYGLMARGEPELVVTIVPDSGTGELAGISGRMTIDPVPDHAYVLTYQLPGLTLA